MEYNEWSDWGQNDWGNGWTNNDTLSQNHQPPQPAIKEQPSVGGRQTGGGGLSQSTAGYFGSQAAAQGGDWFVQNQTQQTTQQQAHPSSTAAAFSYESNNNNSTAPVVNQIENREVAPPDNRQSFNPSRSPPRRHDPQPTRPDQYSAPPLNFQARQQGFNNSESSNLSNYFEPTHSQLPSTRAKPQNPPPISNFNYQATGPIGFSGGLPQQEQLENVQLGKSGQLGSLASTIQKSVNQNFTHQTEQQSNFNYNPPLSHASNFPPPRSSTHSLGQRVSNSNRASLNFHQQTFEQKLTDTRSSGAGFGEQPATPQPPTFNNNTPQQYFGSSNLNVGQAPSKPSGQPKYVDEEQTVDLQTSSSWEQQPPQERPVKQLQPPAVHPPPATVHRSEQPSFDRPPSLGQHFTLPPPALPKTSSASSLENQASVQQPVFAISEQPQPADRYPPSLEKTSSASSLEQQQPSSGAWPSEPRPPSTGQYPTSKTQSTFEQHSSDQHVSSVALERPSSTGQQPPMSQNSPFSIDQNVNYPERPPSRHQYPQTSQKSVSIEDRLPSDGYPPPTSSPPMNHQQSSFIQQPLIVSDRPPSSHHPHTAQILDPPEEQNHLDRPPSIGYPPQKASPPLNDLQFAQQSQSASNRPPSAGVVHQRGPSASFDSQVSVSLRKSSSPGLPQPPLQERPSSSPFQPSSLPYGPVGSTSTTPQNLKPLQLDDEQQAYRRHSPSPQQAPQPPPQTPRGPPSAFHVPSKNFALPVATSSPIVGNCETPNIQDASPENEEYPDNTENIAGDFKALSINHPKQIEPEIQQHCAIDRNQYLETGQFSAQKEGGSYAQNIEQNDEDLEYAGGEAPPPGLDRMVTGQGCEPAGAAGGRGGGGGGGLSGGGPGTSSHLSLRTGGGGGGGAQLPSSTPTRQSTPLSSIGGESEGGDEGESGRREVPGEAEPLKGRVVVGQVPTPPQDQSSKRKDRGGGERGDRLERMVVGEQQGGQTGGGGGGGGGGTADDYRQTSRTSRHHKSRHLRTDSSYEEEDIDYSSDRERQNDDHRRRDERPRRRREHRSPEYRSDEEYEDRRGYHRSGRDSRRRREYSPDRSYYRDYYRDEEPPRHRHYYPRDYDDYYRGETTGGGGGGGPRSRPSSRSGSDYRGPLKHSVRLLPQHHYYDPYSGGTAGGPGGAVGYPDYSLKYSQRTVEYFERMRLTDPAGYAAWYTQYMAGRHLQESAASSASVGRGGGAAAFSSDRASVHSGQSSTHQRHGISTPQEGIEDLTREEDEEDYTPRLYDCAHIRGTMDGQGRMVLVEPNYPLDGERATVSLCRLPQLALDKDSEDFLHTPGPFIPGITHRNTVLQYLKKRSERATSSSEKLLYELVYMTVKGNGEVVGSDVAELLLESYNNSTVASRRGSSEVGTEESETNPPAGSRGGGGAQVSERGDVTSKFRELLQQGNKAEALDWAMENGAWGHALFLASKMDERTHNEIMLRFANSIPQNDPLQTLYQLMSGYIPQAATCCADKKWSDWRPHLAMILSNPTGNRDLDRQAIITLGDSLNGSGRLFAAHFCYVTAQVEFSDYSEAGGGGGKLVLLGSSHQSQEFLKFASCSAILLTLAYEYGLKLRLHNFSIPTLQMYKLLLAGRLLDSGRVKQALQYCELVAREVLSSPAAAAETGGRQRHLLAHTLELASRLKLHDPVVALSGKPEADPDWLADLRHLVNSFPDENGLVSHSQSPLTAAPEANTGYTHQHQDVPYQVGESGGGMVGGGLVPTYPVLSSGGPAGGGSYLQPQQQPQPSALSQSYTSLPAAAAVGDLSAVQPPPHHLSSRSQSDTQHPPEDVYRPGGFMQPPSLHQPFQQHSSLGYLGGRGEMEGLRTGSESLPEMSRQQEAEEQSGGGWEQSGGGWEQQQPHSNQPPSISLIQASSDQSRNSFFKTAEEQLKADEGEEKAGVKVLNEIGGGGVRGGGAGGEKRNEDGGGGGGKTKSTGGGGGGGKSGEEQQSSGWFGGILDKFALRPKNQMRLPDDRNPSIIWDEKKKRWVNLDGEEESSASAKPPPKASEALPPQGNKYKIQKGKLMKNNYVDIMGTRDKTETSLLPNSGGLPPQPKPNFFIPAPVEGNENAPIDFITPAPHNPVIVESTDHTKQQQLSRSSSVSSLSREVQYYMESPSKRLPPKGYYPPPVRASGNGPLMYNPARFPS